MGIHTHNPYIPFSDRKNFFLVRHEQAAVHAADGYAKATLRLRHRSEKYRLS